MEKFVEVSSHGERNTIPKVSKDCKGERKDILFRGCPGKRHKQALQLDAIMQDFIMKYF